MGVIELSLRLFRGGGVLATEDGLFRGVWTLKYGYFGPPMKKNVLSRGLQLLSNGSVVQIRVSKKILLCPGLRLFVNFGFGSCFRIHSVGRGDRAASFRRITFGRTPFGVLHKMVSFVRAPTLLSSFILTQSLIAQFPVFLDGLTHALQNAGLKLV